MRCLHGLLRRLVEAAALEGYKLTAVLSPEPLLAATQEIALGWGV